MLRVAEENRNAETNSVDDSNRAERITPLNTDVRSDFF